MLIELEELKNKINNSKYYGTDAWRDILNMASECENKDAPSEPKGLDELVESLAKEITYEEFVIMEIEAKAYAQDFKDGMESRPKGKWKDVHANYKYIKACSECGWQHDVVHYGDSFCPNCGVDMDKESK